MWNTRAMVARRSSLSRSRTHAKSAQVIVQCPRSLQILPFRLPRFFSTSSSASSSNTKSAQMVVAALTVAGTGYLLVATGRQSEQEKQQRDLEIAHERKLSARLAAELVTAEANQHKSDWKATLERVVPAIVSLKLNSPKV
ncbi:hypothetical protein CCR75_000201 [Bremia lactucae]|uniref:Uncharacterized protein n=1 Tax=Bremia lactucae TaxID=4779 RepID=A0A976FE94_BRELC|nr:hypothetical protein CCR75_000201 [Bremia lactucae]